MHQSYFGRTKRQKMYQNLTHHENVHKDPNKVPLRISICTHICPSFLPPSLTRRSTYPQVTVDSGSYCCLMIKGLSHLLTSVSVRPWKWVTSAVPLRQALGCFYTTIGAAWFVLRTGLRCFWMSLSASLYRYTMVVRPKIVRLCLPLVARSTPSVVPILWLGAWILDRRALFGGREAARHGAEGVHAGAGTKDEALQETTKMPPSLVAGSVETVVVPIKTVVDPGQTVVDPHSTVVVTGKTAAVEHNLVVEPGRTTVLPGGMVAALRLMVVRSRKMVVQLGRTVVASAGTTLVVAPWVAALSHKRLTVSVPPWSSGRFHTPRPLRAYPIRGPTRHRRSWHSPLDLHGSLVPGRAARPPPLGEATRAGPTGVRLLETSLSR